MATKSPSPNKLKHPLICICIYIYTDVLNTTLSSEDIQGSCRDSQGLDKCSSNQHRQSSGKSYRP